MMVNAARMMVTIQKRMVIFDSWKQLRLLPQILAVRIQLTVPVLRKLSWIGVRLKIRCFTPLRFPSCNSNLHHHAEAFYEENTAEDRHQLLVDDDGTYCDDTADGQKPYRP